MICFQFWVSLTSLSLLGGWWPRYDTLWFAFNFGYLWHRYHFLLIFRCWSIRCDLLSILGIFDIAITSSMYGKCLPIVVICFQFWVSLTSLSLWRKGSTIQFGLWFAFNFGYLWHRYHLTIWSNSLKIRCDLLSILGIFDIAITYTQRYEHLFQLWFAFNFGYLWHRYH